MSFDKRLRNKVKSMLDKEPYSSKYDANFELGNFLAKLQGVREDFLGASAAAIGTNLSVVTSAKNGLTWTAAYVANDAAAAPVVSGAGIAVTTNTAENDGVIFYNDVAFTKPEASSNDKLIFEALFNMTTVANCDEAGFIISNESVSNLNADTVLTGSNTYIGININEGSVELISDLNAGAPLSPATGLSVTDGEDIHVKIEISDARTASVYVNGQLVGSSDGFTFDAADEYRPVFGAIVDATEALGTINVKEVCAYRLISQ